MGKFQIFFKNFGQLLKINTSQTYSDVLCCFADEVEDTHACKTNKQKASWPLKSNSKGVKALPYIRQILEKNHIDKWAN